MAVLVTCKFDDNSIKNESAIVPTTFPPLYVYGKNYGSQGHVALKRISQSGPKSNSSEILCLSWLSASLDIIRSNMKALSCP